MNRPRPEGVGNCPPGSLNHVENVFFNDFALPGQYTVFVRNYDGRAATPFRIDVVAHGTLTSHSGTLAQPSGSESPHYMFTY